MRGLAEGSIGRGAIAKRPIAAEVVGRVIEQQGRVSLDRVKHADDRREHVIVDDDGLGGALRLLAGLGNDERDRIADVAHFALGKRRMRRLFHRQPVLAGNAPAAGQAADAARFQMLAGEHGKHARHGKRRSRFDHTDRSVRVR